MEVLHATVKWCSLLVGGTLASVCFGLFLFEIDWIVPVALPVVHLSGPLAFRVAFNLLIVMSFGAAHTILASRSMTKQLATLLPAQLVRPLYVGESGAHLACIALCWQPLPELGTYVWRVGLEQSTEVVANAGLAVLGLCYIAVVIQSMGAAEFVGLSSPTSEAGASSDGASVQRSGGVARDNGLRKRVHTSTGDAADTGGGGSGGSGGGTAAAAGTVVDGADGGGHIEPFNPVLVTTGFYGFSRHPMYTGLLFVLFCTPAMTVDRFVFSVGLLAYLLSFGIRMEEAKLLDVFGPPYAEYQKKVGSVCPWV